MKIAILSDIHDHIWNLEKAIKIVKRNKSEALLFCGDMCAPFTAEILGRLNIPVYVVWGNVDGDPWGISRKGGEDFIIPPDGQDFSEAVLDGKKIALTHYPDNAKLLFNTGYYDAVFHGHSHISYKKRVKGKIIANPGAVCGIVSGKAGLASFMIYNTKENNLKLMKIK